LFHTLSFLYKNYNLRLLDLLSVDRFQGKQKTSFPEKQVLLHISQGSSPVIMQYVIGHTFSGSNYQYYFAAGFLTYRSSSYRAFSDGPKQPKLNVRRPMA